MIGGLVEEAERRRGIEARLSACWRAWGYREVVPPAWLPWEEVAFGAAGLPEQACKLLDPHGQVLSLRPDNTLLVARLVARDLAGEPRPLRLHYAAEVYRRQRGGEVVALPQVGLELIGSASPLADAEVLALAAEGLRSLGVREFRLAVGHVGVLRDFLERAGLPASAGQAVMQALQDRDFVALERAVAGVEGLGAAAREGLLERLTVPVPAAAWPGVPPAGGGGAGEPWGNLAEVLSLLRLSGLEDQVVVELGLVRDLDYYTGLVFEVAAPGVARPLGGGGRYDGLLARFGPGEPATGFAFDLQGLLRVVADGGARPGRTLVVAADGQASRAWARARALRAAGRVVELELSGRSLDEALRYARRRGMGAVLAVRGEGEEEFRL